MEVDPRGRRHDPRLFHTLERIVWLGAGVALLLRFLDAATSAVLFLAMSVIIAIGLNVPVVWLTSKGWSRGLATLLVCVVVLGAMVGVGFLVVPVVIEQTTELVRQIPDFVERLSTRFSSWLATHPSVAAQVQTPGESAGVEVGPIAQQAVSRIGKTSVSVFTAVATVFLVATAIIFMLLRPRPLLDAYLSLFPSKSWDRAEQAFVDGSNGVVGWLWSNVIVGTFEATAAGIFLTVMDVPGGIVFAVLTFFAELVPYLGVYVMTIPPVLVSLAVDPWLALWVLLFYLALTLVFGSILAPWLRGHTMDLHPVAIIVAIVALGAVYGPLGVILSVPVAGFASAFWNAFYLSDRPPDPERPSRVEAMLARRRHTLTPSVRDRGSA